MVRAAISAAYVTEYGLDPAKQSCLNMLLFLHLDKRRRFTPFGVFSDERFHLVGGNDAIATNIAARLPEPVQMGMKLTRLGMNSAASTCCGSRTRRNRVADTVVMTLPFTSLRQVSWSRALGFHGQATSDPHARVWEQRQDDDRVPWQALADREREQRVSVHEPGNVQTTWETSPMTPGAVSILTDYAGGERGRTLALSSVQEQVAKFVADLEHVYQGVAARR